MAATSGDTREKKGLHQRLKELRSDDTTAKAGMRWTREEDDYLQSYVSKFVRVNKNGLIGEEELDTIAAHLHRTHGAIKLRNLKNAVMYLNGLPSEDVENVAKMYGVSSDDLTAFIETTKIKEERTKEAKERTAQKKASVAPHPSAITKSDVQELFAVMNGMKESVQKLTIEVVRLQSEISSLKATPSKKK